MLDPTYLFNKQLSEFLNEYKNRFVQINYQGSPYKLAYSTKLNRNDINSTLNV